MPELLPREVSIIRSEFAQCGVQIILITDNLDDMAINTAIRQAVARHGEPFEIPASTKHQMSNAAIPVFTVYATDEHWKPTELPALVVFLSADKTGAFFERPTATQSWADVADIAFTAARTMKPIAMRMLVDAAYRDRVNAACLEIRDLDSAELARVLADIA